MAENTMGKLLPNLKITLGNDSDSDTETEEGEISDTIDDLDALDKLEELSKNEEEKKNVNVVRTWTNTLNDPKVYENKSGAFITGLDLSSEALVKKLQERAERFGLEKKVVAITQKEIDALYKSLGIEPENLNTCKLKNIRLESLHMRGIEEMNTKEIFAYFKDYGPSSVEWINDVSCNVVWMDAATTARAMIGMSRPLIIRKKGAIEQGITESLTKEDEVKGSEVEDVIEMSDSEEKVEKSMEIDAPSDMKEPEKLEAKNSPSEETSEVNVPVPPGHWRLGVPHPKSKAILLRFATRDDKKLPGAEKRSQYYQKYGNPNYGGLKGLISSSRKRKMQAARNRQVVEKIIGESSQSEINSGETSKRPIVKTSRTKMPRMRMYADDEEKKKGYFLSHESGRQSVHSRLGTKYTKDDLSQLGNRFSSESEEDDNIAIHCTVPSRFNVWTDIAKTMAKEDRWRPQSNSSDDQLYDYRKYGNDSAVRGRFLARDQSPEPMRGSRPWRPSQDESSDLRSSLGSRKGQSPLCRPEEDLRSYMSSRQEESPLTGPEEDLRSRIKQIKKEDADKKHRSPMYMYD